MRDELWESRRDRRDRRIRIDNLGGGVWRVSGTAVERMVVLTDWDNEEAVAYLQHRFDRMGLDDALAKAGVRTGDEVRILGYALDYAGPEADTYGDLTDGEDEDEPVLTVGEISEAAGDGEESTRGPSDEGDASADGVVDDAAEAGEADE